MWLGQMLFDIMFNVLGGIDGVFDVYKFDVVFVYGDMIIMLVVSLVVFYWCILVGYVEVGLWIGNIWLLWLEELNWCVIDFVIIWYFVFMVELCQNLLDEGIDFEQVMFIGNIVIDVLLVVK